MSRIAVYFPLGDGTRDRGEEVRFLEYSKKEIKIKKALKFKSEKEILVDDILSVDAWREVSVAKDQKAAGNAAVGGLLFGTVGAVVGAATTESYTWYGEIVTQTETVKFRFDKEADAKGFIKWWEKLEKKNSKK